MTILDSKHSEHTKVTETLALAAALELLIRIANVDCLQKAAKTTALELRTFFSAERVVIGWFEVNHDHCKVVGDTSAVLYENSKLASRVTIAALDEITCSGQTVEIARSPYPPATLAVQRFANSQHASYCIGTAIVDASGRVCGAILLLDPQRQVDDLSATNLVDTMSRPLGAGLAIAYQHQTSRAEQVLAKVKGLVTGNRTTWLISAALLVLLVALFPIRYQVRCDCELQPVSRRYVVSPMDGALDESMVRPGDVVEKDEILARLSARELDWELAGLKADMSRATKQRKVALAKQDYAASQIAELESQQLQHQTSLLESRMQSLEVRSPIRGVVVAGDVHEVEGAPLDRGQGMFEVAPLGEMIADLRVDEADYVYVRKGMSVRLRLQAFSNDVIEGVVEQMHPTAEVIDHKNVFVAEIRIADPHRIYRPGMHGRAKIASDRKPMLWVMFHKPWAALMLWLG